MKKINKKDIKKDTGFILQGIGAGAVICVSFAAGFMAKEHMWRPARLSIITDKAVTCPGLKIEPKRFKGIIGSRNFIFKNCKEANEFVDMFNQCVLDCSKNSGVS